MVLAFAMVLGTVCLPAPATAYAQTTAEKLEETKEKVAELKNQLDAAKAGKQNAMEQKYILDQRNTALLEEIELIEMQIGETTARIEENEAQEAVQYEIFCRQTREEEERGMISYWSVLFKAKSFTDLLSRLDFVNEVMNYNQSVIDELQRIRAQLAADRTALEEQKADLDAAKAELEEQLAAANTLIAQYSAQEGAIQKMYDEEAAAAAQLEEEIRRYNEEQERLRKQREEEERRQREQQQQQQQQGETGGDNSGSPGATSGGYAWPTNDTRLITSPVGWRSRASTNYIGTTNHQGVDIGASYGTNILASKSGTVILARWYGGLGNCVIIQHGAAGYYTTYGHMSRILVSEGQQVSQGQVIGLVGNTGNSNGPHIHFEIHEDYALKDPLNYLTGWVRYGW
jgi:murein DD-endopeptidase MepM/ murein hydrolase activator NlpD